MIRFSSSPGCAAKSDVPANLCTISCLEIGYDTAAKWGGATGRVEVVLTKHLGMFVVIGGMGEAEVPHVWQDRI
jgi:hypothetical protein